MAFDFLSRITANRGESFFRLMFYGRNGTGKTSLASSAPDPLILNFDKKEGSIPEGVKRLNFKSDDPAYSVGLEIAKAIHGKSAEFAAYKTVVLDSISSLSEDLLAGILVASKGDPAAKAEFDDYAKVRQSLIILINTFKSLPVNLIVTALPQLNEDNVSGVPIVLPLIVGGYKQQACAAFDDVYYTRKLPGSPDGARKPRYFIHPESYVETNLVEVVNEKGRVEKTPNVTVYEAKNSFGLPATIENPSWAELMAKRTK